MSRIERTAGQGTGGRAGGCATRACTTLGLAGGIGSGKTTVAGLLAKLGAKVMDADAICSDLHRTAEVKTAIRARWGAEMFGPDGELDRPHLAAAVFGKPGEVAALNAILHPKVVDRITRAIAGCRAAGSPDLCVIDAPLLFESGLDRLCDAIVFVECDEAARRERLARSRGWSDEEGPLREAHQRALADKRNESDFVIVNSGDRAATRQQVQHLVENLRNRLEK